MHAVRLAASQLLLPVRRLRKMCPAASRQATHLLKYDSTLGPFAGTVSAVDDHTLSVDGKHIRVSACITLPLSELAVPRQTTTPL